MKGEDACQDRVVWNDAPTGKRRDFCTYVVIHGFFLFIRLNHRPEAPPVTSP